ncbi:Copper-transporting ATPase PAA1 [Arachis hypogaea]|nr:Copper-transporting ATPase PAA1 [Arachis hypogaea]
MDENAPHSYTPNEFHKQLQTPFTLQISLLSATFFHHRYSITTVIHRILPSSTPLGLPLLSSLSIITLAGLELNPRYGSFSVHPVGKAIVDAAQKVNCTNTKVTDGTFLEEPGSGAVATVDNKKVFVGTLDWITSYTIPHKKDGLRCCDEVDPIAKILKDRRLNETAVLGVPVKATIKEIREIRQKYDMVTYLLEYIDYPDQIPFGEGMSDVASSRDLRLSLDWCPEKGWTVPMPTDYLFYNGAFRQKYLADAIRGIIFQNKVLRIKDKSIDQALAYFCEVLMSIRGVLPEPMKYTARTGENSPRSSGTSLLRTLRIQSLGKLNPIDLKRLSFHMSPPHKATQNKKINEELDREMEVDHKDGKAEKDDALES